ncbi:hypothetical protein GCM10023149_16770 [Mucilaginibacter gynuensis]|uniref:CBM11 domain-containing protein n=2 Tax=Mucilaginibacter gynuensis TaxID=1302236 RepID=A0ABP8G759_9SPHI
MVCSIAVAALTMAGCKKEKFKSRDTSQIVPPPDVPIDTVVVDPSLVLFASADDAADWSTVGAVNIETENKKEGTGYIKNTITNGNEFMQFIYKPATPLDTKLTATNGQFMFWWYLSDPSLVKADGQIEINSVGDFDKEEYGWSIAALKPTLKAGWNEIKLNFNAADKAGGDFNPASVKQFRIFFFTEGKDHADLISGVDGLKFRIAPPMPDVSFDKADLPDGWETVGTPTIETNGKKEGIGYLKNTIANGGDFMQFIKQLPAPLNTTFTENNGQFKFWWYISDVSLLKADGSIEMTSSGKSDAFESAWDIAPLLPTLKNGWNEIKLDFSTAIKTGDGGANYAAVDHFRIFFFTTGKDHGDLITGIDDLRFGQKP